MKHLKWIALVALLALAALLWHSSSRDPLAEMKRETAEAVADPAAQAVVEKALAKIQSDDMKGLFALMGGDPMAFDETYTKDMFATKDFCPAEVRTLRKVARGGAQFLQAEVFSATRKKLYLFTLAQHKASFKISSIEEIPDR